MSTFSTLTAEDEVVRSENVYRTKDYGKKDEETYGKFKFIKGNRAIDKLHVNQLIHRFETYGDLLDQFPIEVTKSGEILDGQHRLSAAREANKYIYYKIVEGNIDTVIVGNSGKKNWSWRDFLNSYAERGNKNYQNLLNIVLEIEGTYGPKSVGYRILATYASLTNPNKQFTNSHQAFTQAARAFRMGDIAFPESDVEQVINNIHKLFDIKDAAGLRMTNELATAVDILISVPDYDHKKLLGNIGTFAKRLKESYTVSDFVMTLSEALDA